MTERSQPDILPQKRLESAELSEVSRRLYDRFSLLFQNPVFKISELRFRNGDNDCLVTFSYHDEQDKVTVSSGDGEYLKIAVARADGGVNSIEYAKHDSNVIYLKDSRQAVEKIEEVFLQLTEGKGKDRDTSVVELESQDMV